MPKELTDEESDAAKAMSDQELLAELPEWVSKSLTDWWGAIPRSHFICLCRELAGAQRENVRLTAELATVNGPYGIRGDLAMAIDILHDAGTTRSWAADWDDDVAELLAKHWPVTKEGTNADED